MSTLFTDTFTGTNGTTLSSHTGESGVTYTRHEDFPVATIAIQSNQAAKDTSTETALYYASVESPRGFVEIECVITDKSEVNRSTGICITDSTTDTGVIFRRQNATTWQLLKIIDGTPSASLLTAGATFSAEAQYTLLLRRLPETNDYECVLDGTVLGVVTITDAEIQPLRKIGIRATNTQGAAVGYHVDSFSAKTLTAPRTLFRGRNFPFFDDGEVNRFEFWPAVSAGVEHESAASISATGSIEVAAQSFSVFERSVVISATAATATAAQFFSVLEREAQVAAVGSVTAVGLRVVERSASLSATSSITVSAQFFSTLERSTTANSTASVTVVGERVVERAVSLSATATVTTSGEFFTLFESAITVSATAAIESSATLFSVAERSVALASTISISSDGIRIIERTLSVTTTVTVQIASESFSVVERTVDVAATGAISITAQFFSTLERQVMITTTATTAASHQLELSRQLSLNAAGAIAVTGGVLGGVFEHERSVAVGATAGIVTSSVVVSVVSRSVEISAAVTVSTSALVERERAVVLSATGSIAVSYQRDSLRDVSLSAVAVIEASGATEGAATERSVSLSATATITVTHAIQHPAPPRRTFMVSSGERTVIVQPDTREFLVADESREEVLV